MCYAGRAGAFDGSFGHGQVLSSLLDHRISHRCDIVINSVFSLHYISPSEIVESQINLYSGHVGNSPETSVSDIATNSTLLKAGGIFGRRRVWLKCICRTQYNVTISSDTYVSSRFCFEDTRWNSILQVYTPLINVPNAHQSKE